jgi:hypothetical protein
MKSRSYKRRSCRLPHVLPRGKRDRHSDGARQNTLMSWILLQKAYSLRSVFSAALPTLPQYNLDHLVTPGPRMQWRVRIDKSFVRTDGPRKCSVGDRKRLDLDFTSPPGRASRSLPTQLYKPGPAIPNDTDLQR